VILLPETFESRTVNLEMLSEDENKMAGGWARTLLFVLTPAVSHFWRESEKIENNSRHTTLSSHTSQLLSKLQTLI
jgi:hypothetical protein